MAMMSLTLHNARCVDPLSGRDAVGTVFIVDGLIADRPAPQARVIDASGWVVAPGLIDARVFQVNPRACAAGGVTRVCLMPDLSPPLEHAAAIAQAATLGDGQVAVSSFAAATKGLQGLEIAEMGLSRRAGAVAVATGRRSIPSARVMARVLAYAKGFDLVVVAHGEDESLVEGAVATEGEVATRMGLAAAPAYAEALQVARDLRLARATGAKIHIAQVTTAESLDLIRTAKAQGVLVSCGVTPAHVLMNDTGIGAWRTFAHLSPPLRQERDRQAVLDALCDGTIDVLCSGHDPRSTDAKRVPYAHSAPGMAGVETLLTLALSLVHDEKMPLITALARMTVAPARLFGLPLAGITPGQRADLVVFDPNAPWQVRAEALVGPGRNTPFEGLPVMGRVKATIAAGHLVFDDTGV